MIHIRPYEPDDWAALLPLLQSTFAAGDTYAFPPEFTEQEVHKAWIEAPAATFVACDDDGTLLGTYFIRPNQPGLGSHVCNCGYIVAPRARGRGVATQLCEHSQHHARMMGFRAMQYNLVVSTNHGAVRLWEKLGFHIAGTLPGAFNHQTFGYVDAYVMYKQLIW